MAHSGCSTARLRSVAACPAVVSCRWLCWHAVGCHAREYSLVLELSQAAFSACWAADDAPGLALRAAVAGSVADSALALSNRLAQLVGLQRAQTLLARQA